MRFRRCACGECDRGVKYMGEASWRRHRLFACRSPWIWAVQDLNLCALEGCPTTCHKSGEYIYIYTSPMDRLGQEKALKITNIILKTIMCQLCWNLLVGSFAGMPLFHGSYEL